LRFLLVLFPYGLIYYTPLVFTIALISIIYGSFATIRQIDLKKIIAYSSIVHMNFALLGLFTNDIEGLQGSLYIMLSHGIVSSALFLCIGILYDKYKTRLITYYGGLVNFMPLFSFFFLSFILSNLGFPGTSSFIGEILVLISIVSYNFKIAVFAAFSMVLSAVYSL
jgi:NADH:ubiquinone oxidoreductase subunit 4 (subunit M)